MHTAFGIIGCGNIARFHCDGLAKAGARIIHVADINADAARPYTERFGARLSTDYRALLADPAVTAVCVLTSSTYHRDICLAALAAGKDVICEKTMMDNAEQAEETARAVAASGRLFFTAFMKRFFPAAQKAKELLPALGRMFSATVRSYQQWGNFYELDSDKGYEWILRNYGGAVLKCAGSHMLDMTLWLLGRPQAVYAHVDYVPQSQLDRKVTAILEYPHGMTATFETAVHPLKKIGYERNSWDEFIEINGVNGRLTLSTVMWDQPERNPALLTHYDNTTETVTEYRADIVNPFHFQSAYFVDCLAQRVQGAPDVIDGFNVDVLIEAIQQAAAARAAVPVNWRGL